MCLTASHGVFEALGFDDSRALLFPCPLALAMLALRGDYESNGRIKPFPNPGLFAAGGQ